MIPKPVRAKTKFAIPDTPFPSPVRFDEEENRRNVKAVVERDGGICRWCELVDGRIKAGAMPHHIFRKRNRWDERAIITLCYYHHDAFHKARQVNGETLVTVEKLQGLIDRIYQEGLDGRKLGK